MKNSVYRSTKNDQGNAVNRRYFYLLQRKKHPIRKLFIKSKKKFPYRRCLTRNKKKLPYSELLTK